MSARIPVSNRVPGRVVAVQPPSGAWGGEIAEAVGRIGRTIGSMGRDMQDEQARAQALRQRTEAEQRDKADRAATLVAMARGEADLEARLDDVRGRILRGEINKEAAPDAWTRASNDALAAIRETIPESQREPAAAHLQAYALKRLNVVRDTALAKDQQDIGASLAQYLEEQQRTALVDRKGATELVMRSLEALGPSAGWTPEQIQKLGQSWKETVDFNAARELVLRAPERADVFDAVAGKLRSEFPSLSPDRLVSLEQQLENRRQSLAHKQTVAAARAEAAAAARDRRAQTAIGALQGLIDGGALPDAPMLQATQRAVQGTAYAPVLDALVKQGAEDAGFAVLTPAQQSAQLLQMRQTLNQQGSNPAIERRMQRLQTIHERQTKAIAEDPLSWGASSRLVDVRPLQMNNFENMAAGLADRVQAAQVVGARLGRPVSPLTAAEAPMLADYLGSLPAQARVRAMATLSQTLGDPGMARALGAQLAAKNAQTGLAMLLASDPRRVPAAELLIRGEEAINTGRMKLDAATQQRQADIAERLSKVNFATPQARDAAIAASQSVYVGLIDARQGASPRKAIELSVGEIADWGESQVPVPAGMTAREFVRRIKGMTANDLAAQAGGNSFELNGRAVTAAELVQQLPQASLISTGGNSYAVQAGGALVTVRGQPFRLRVGVSADVR